MKDQDLKEYIEELQCDIDRMYQDLVYGAFRSRGKQSFDDDLIIKGKIVNAESILKALNEIIK